MMTVIRWKTPPPPVRTAAQPTTTLMRIRMDVCPFNPDSETWGTWFSHFQEAADNNDWS